MFGARIESPFGRCGELALLHFFLSFCVALLLSLASSFPITTSTLTQYCIAARTHITHNTHLLLQYCTHTTHSTHTYTSYCNTAHTCTHTSYSNTAHTHAHTHYTQHTIHIHTYTHYTHTRTHTCTHTLSPCRFVAVAFVYRWGSLTRSPPASPPNSSRGSPKATS
jgi:hypothetical protein